MSMLDQLREMTIVVADTGDIDAIAQHRPQDATTNPSLLYKAAQMPQYRELIEAALEFGAKAPGGAEGRIDATIEYLFVRFGKEILDIIPGRVSTEVSARLSFDTEATIEKARHLIRMYEAEGVDRERVLIKIASTWEGIRAAERLEPEGIHCNLTLLFSLAQAVACAEAGVTLVSPFVGRIHDWYKKDRGVDSIPPADDPGVHSVTAIYNYFKHFGYATSVMGASFRNRGEIIELAGCDLLTISPALLEELEGEPGPLERRLSPETARDLTIERIPTDERSVRWMVNEDAMATEKLAEGIRNFNADSRRLEGYLAQFAGEPVAAK